MQSSDKPRQPPNAQTKKSLWNGGNLTSYIEDYCARIRQGGAAAVIAQPVVVDSDGTYVMSYVPFEHANPDASLILASTTPGHMHVRLAAELTETLLRAHAPGRVIQLENKRQIELGGALVRPNLIRMLDHFGIPALVGVESAAALWEEGFPLLQPLALLPQATMRRGLAFDGTLETLLAAPMLRRAFETLFIERLGRIRDDAVYVALGRTAWAGLRHAADAGVIDASQLLGMMPVPARAGSMVRYFLGEIGPASLSPKDPVRHRTAWLDAARRELIDNVRLHRLTRSGSTKNVTSAAA